MKQSEFITRVFGSPYELCAEAAIQIVDEAAKAIYVRGKFTLVLSGGTTPKTVYQLLGTQYHEEVDWEKTFLFLGDERLVPLDHPESNFKMVKETLLNKISIPEQNIFRVNTDSTDAVKEYEDSIRAFFELQTGEYPHFDLVMLGLGEDGHTASLFPRNAALKEQSAIVTHVHIPQNELSERLTLTLPVFNNARKVVFLVTGRSKAKIVAEIYDDPECTYPARFIVPRDGEVYWYLDLDSSSLVSSECKLSP